MVHTSFTIEVMVRAYHTYRDIWHAIIDESCRTFANWLKQSISQLNFCGLLPTRSPGPLVQKLMDETYC